MAKTVKVKVDRSGTVDSLMSEMYGKNPKQWPSSSYLKELPSALEKRRTFKMKLEQTVITKSPSGSKHMYAIAKDAGSESRYAERYIINLDNNRISFETDGEAMNYYDGNDRALNSIIHRTPLDDADGWEVSGESEEQKRLLKWNFKDKISFSNDSKATIASRGIGGTTVSRT